MNVVKAFALTPAAMQIGGWRHPTSPRGLEDGEPWVMPERIVVATLPDRRASPVNEKVSCRVGSTPAPPRAAGAHRCRDAAVAGQNRRARCGSAQDRAPRCPSPAQPGRVRRPLLSPPRSHITPAATEIARDPGHPGRTRVPSARSDHRHVMSFGAHQWRLASTLRVRFAVCCAV